MASRLALSNKVTPIPFLTELERLIVIPLYVFLNVAPFVLPLVALAVGGGEGLLFLVFIVVLLELFFVVLVPMVKKKMRKNRRQSKNEAHARAQYLYTERNNINTNRDKFIGWF